MPCVQRRKLLFQPAELACERPRTDFVQRGLPIPFRTANVVRDDEMAVNDVVLHGAAGFVGQLVAACLARHPHSSRFYWATAGHDPNEPARIRDFVVSQGTEPGAIVEGRLMRFRVLNEFANEDYSLPL